MQRSMQLSGRAVKDMARGQRKEDVLAVSAFVSDKTANDGVATSATRQYRSWATSARVTA